MCYSVIFLGTAQDAGIPQLMCTCDNCKQYQRYIASLAIVDEKKNECIVIDATSDLREQWKKLEEMYPNIQLKSIIITHGHIGHIHGLFFLGKEGPNLNNIHIYMDQEIWVKNL